MKKVAQITLIVSGTLTVILLLVWVAGFLFAPSIIGNLIHMALVLAVLTGFVAFIAAILFVVSLISRK